VPQPASRPIPRSADTVIVGSGTAGAVLAARLVEQSSRSVLLLEAGPDFGPFEAGGWPQALLDARTMPVDLVDWGYVSAATHGAPGLRIERARVIGGCSSHNGVAMVWGHRQDYDGWVVLGNPGWGADALLPLFRRTTDSLRVWQPRRDEISPYHQATLDAGPLAGIPVADDLNSLDLEVGIAISPANIYNGIRWNSAFAYLDPLRGRPSFTIGADTLVDRVLVEHGRVVGLDVVGPDGPTRIHTSQVVLAGGVFGSPLILLRSGIGDPAELRPFGIPVVQALPGVGKNLHDHPAIQVIFRGSQPLIQALLAWKAAGGLLREDATIVKARSSLCHTAHDLHLYPLNSRASGSWAGNRHLAAGGQWIFGIPASNLVPRSRGRVRLTSPDPEARPELDHAYLTDEDDQDLRVVLDGIELARGLAAQPPLAGLLGPELAPGPRTRAELASYIRANSTYDYHSVGTCKMGPATDPLAVVDARGAVHGLEGLYVADASIMPVIPRANTNAPTVVVGDRIAGLLLGEQSPA
jgi:choline dehydrogenase